MYHCYVFVAVVVLVGVVVALPRLVLLVLLVVGLVALLVGGLVVLVVALGRVSDLVVVLLMARALLPTVQQVPKTLVISALAWVLVLLHLIMTLTVTLGLLVGLQVTTVVPAQRPQASFVQQFLSCRGSLAP